MITHAPVLGGSTDISCLIRVIDATDGTPETGFAHDTSGIDLWYRRGAQGAVVSITEAALAAVDSAHTDGGVEHVNNGYVRVDLPDAAVAAGVNHVQVGGTATGMVVIGALIPIVAYNAADGVRLGLTALPNAAADAAGGLIVSDAGGLDADAQLVTKINDILTDTGTTLQNELDGIQADTEDIQTQIGAAGAGLSAIPWNADWDAEVESEANDALIAQNLDHLVKSAVDTDFATTVQVNSVIGHLADDGGGYDRSTDSLEVVQANFSTISTQIDNVDNFLDTEIAAIKAVTDLLPDAGALTSLATQASVDAIDNFLDTEIAAILEDTGTTIDDLVDDLESRLTAALATQLQAHSLGVLRGVVDASSTTTAVIFKSINGAAASATNDFYNGRHIVFTSGTLLGQACSIDDYTGATVTATVPALTGAPAEDVTFVIV